MPKRPLRLISLEFFRQQLAKVDAFPQLALLGAVSGLLTGAVILLFRMAIELPLTALVGGPDNFEALGGLERLLLPIIGGLLMALLLSRLSPDERRVGVVHVMERLSRHQGHLPLKNAVTQFLGGVVALVSGHSMGREGPAVHLGGAAASLMGQALELPNNSIRTLVSCGTAAAIAASFNTPMAGVIFAMEVVMMEYTMSSFIPVILAAVSATILSHAVYGPQPAFLVPSGLELNSLWEYPFVIGEGLLIGALAALFVVLTHGTARLSGYPLIWRMLAVGVLTGVTAVFIPQVMGIGYDTLNYALLGQLSLLGLAVIGAAKLVVSATAAGLGVPAGIIGPTLMIGGMAGGVIGMAGSMISPEQVSPTGVYVTLGMAAMMGAVLQAPLAALVAVLELTANPGIVPPAMLVIVVATLTLRMLGQRSLFLATLDNLGLGYATDPITQHLQRVGVVSVMNRNFVRLYDRVSRAEAAAALASKPDWVIIENEQQPLAVLNASDLARHLEAEPATPPGAADVQAAAPAAAGEDDADAVTELQLTSIAGLRLDVASINAQATLHEALETLDRSGKEALCVHRMSAPLIQPIVGVLTRKDIELTLQFGKR